MKNLSLSLSLSLPSHIDNMAMSCGLYPIVRLQDGASISAIFREKSFLSFLTKGPALRLNFHNLENGIFQIFMI